MVTDIHGNSGFPGVKSLVIHGRASSMVEMYSMAGEVSRHHVPLQCAGDLLEMTRLRLYTGIHRETVFQVSGVLWSVVKHSPLVERYSGEASQHYKSLQWLRKCVFIV